MESKNYLSYKYILESIKNFKRSNGDEALDFTKFDTPNQYYFKIFFYFHNGDVGNDSKSNGNDTGLLAPTWQFVSSPGNDTPYYSYNSAWSYFMMNADPVRAEKVKQFVTLLSNISSYTPWYFSEINGLDGAVERKTVMEKDFKISEEPYRIDIKCLPDAVDDRISTLLDLYRDITFDWINKLQLLPSNLRKFDMGIYVFSSPIANIHGKPGFNIPKVKKKTKDGTEIETHTHNFDFEDRLNSDEFAQMDVKSTNSSYITSYKYFELHNCEIDYSTSKNTVSSLNNKEGFSQEHVISIRFDDVYEMRYNEYLMNVMGDLILDNNYNPLLQLTEDMQNKMYNELERRMFSDNVTDTEKEEKIEEDSNFATELKNLANSFVSKPDFSQFGEGALEQLDAFGRNAAKSLLKRALLGNLHTISLSKASAQVGSLAQGNVLGTARAVQDYYSNFKLLAKDSQTDYIGNLHEQPKTLNRKVESIGNLHKGNSMVKNI